jgi:hypothetical protein
MPLLTENNFRAWLQRVSQHSSAQQQLELACDALFPHRMGTSMHPSRSCNSSFFFLFSSSTSNSTHWYIADCPFCSFTSHQFTSHFAFALSSTAVQQLFSSWSFSRFICVCFHSYECGVLVACLCFILMNAHNFGIYYIFIHLQPSSVRMGKVWNSTHLQQFAHTYSESR